MNRIATVSGNMHGAGCSCCQNRFGNRPNMDATLTDYAHSLAQMAAGSKRLEALKVITQAAEEQGIESMPSEVISQALLNTQKGQFKGLNQLLSLQALKDAQGLTYPQFKKLGKLGLQAANNETYQPKLNAIA